MILKNFDRANLYFDFEKKIEISTSEIIEVSGWYMIKDRDFFALFVKDQHIYCTFYETTFKVDEKCKLTIKSISDNFLSATFTLNNDVIQSFKIKKHDPIETFSPFEYIDNDDYDWGEFISKVINDIERRKNFIAALS